VTLDVLHLAPHYGGGVGTVVRALIRESGRQRGYRHRVASLEPVGAPMRQWAAEYGIECTDDLHHRDDLLGRLLAGADLVHLHWWQHPLLNALMHRPDLPGFRCLLWSHVNGHHAPQNFPTGLADYPDMLVLASAWSLHAPALAVRGRQGPLPVIHSSAGVPAMPPRRMRGDGQFRIGYVGTVDPIKMHPEFVPLCLRADIPNARFVVAGGPEHRALRDAVLALGVADRFEILGSVDDVPALMATLDVFGYPLNPQHYGTGEQVLIEAMAAGVVPVVLDGSSERYTVEHGVSGLVCADAGAYPDALRRLAQDRSLRKRLSLQARQSVAGRFSIEDVVGSWHRLYRDTSARPATRRCLPGRAAATRESRYSPAVELLLDAVDGTPVADLLPVFLHDVPSRDDDALRAAAAALPVGFFSATRGTPFHYRQFFPDDPDLAALCRCLGRFRTAATAGFVAAAARPRCEPADLPAPRPAIEPVSIP